MSSEKELLILDVQRRICEESITRIQRSLDLLNEEQIWSRSNENSNSIGNLVLHLNGNVRQWIFSGSLGEKDTRNRAEEFSQKEIIPKEKLKEILFNLTNELVEKLPLLRNIDLLEEKKIQGIYENGVSMLLHVTEHFSYHTGQIALLTKQMLNRDLGFYDESNLNDLNDQK